MKEKRYYIRFLLFATLIAFVFTACHTNEGPTPSNKVRLYGSLSYAKTDTKGNATSTSGIKNTDSDEALNISLVRIDQNYSGDPNYPKFLSCRAPITGKLHKPDPANDYKRDIEFISEPQFFRNQDDDIRYASWYPRSGVFVTNTTSTKVTFPINGETDVMYGDVAKGNKHDGFNMVTFNHALSQFRFYVYATALTTEDDPTGVSTANRWGALTEMGINSVPSECTITLPIDATGTQYEISYSASTFDLSFHDSSNNIFWDPGTALPLGIGNKRLVAKCISAPPVSGILDIAIKTEHATAAQQVSIARNFKPGCAYDIILRFTDHGMINAEVSVAEWQTYPINIQQETGVSMYYNLSTYGTANSYMINSANYGYSFDGTVMGNGVGTPVGVTNTTLNPGYIDVLWSDMLNVPLDITNDGVSNPVPMQTVQLVSNTLSMGKVLFKVLGNTTDPTDRALLAEGNVIIAAYEDASKAKILWTWHIWVCDKVKVHGYLSGYTAQDRNLGAISNIPVGTDYTSMHGLYYQWGRPTPFKNPSLNYYTLSRATNTTTVANAIANPMTIFGSLNTTTYDWLNPGTPKADNLWGWVSDSEDDVKTIYDPCPHGYRSPDYRMWKNMSDFQITSVAGKGVNLSIASQSIFYPYQGYLNPDNGTVDLTTHPLFLWATSISNLGKPYYFTYDSGASAIHADGKRNIAAPIRCISTKGTSIVKNLSATQTANSYIVSKEGYYKFKATVRGNGVGALFPLGGDHMAFINDDLTLNIAPAKVDVLWWQGDFAATGANALLGNPTDPQNFMCINLLNGGVPDSEGYVTFYIDKFYKGNTVLAAYDGANTILWTWHIWLTDTPSDVASGKYSLMDRFLGATYAPNITATINFASDNQRLATYGFYYQWGRKDPFIGPPTYNSGSPTNLSSSRWWVKNGTSWDERTAISTSQANSVNSSASNPMTFYYSGSIQGATNSGWYPPSFSDAYANVVMWGYAVANWAIQGQTFSKTMHDPCPPGYRTPFHYAWDGEIPGLYTGETYRYIPYNEAEGNITLANNESSFTTNGIVLNKGNFAKNWYPFTGFRAPGTGRCTEVGTAGLMSTGMPMGQYNTRYYNYNSTVTGQRRHYFSDSYEKGAAFGMPVRCQKD